MTDRSVLAYMSAHNDGELDAPLFLQSLINHGSAMSADIAGGAFSEAVVGEFNAFTKSDNKEVDIGRLFGYLSFFGKVLWEQTKAHRKALDTVAPLRGKAAKVIPIARVDGQKRRPDAD